MTRRRRTSYYRRPRYASSRSGKLQIRGVERVLFILGALLYLIGVFGGINLLAMPPKTAILLLGTGGGLLLVLTLTFIF